MEYIESIGFTPKNLKFFFAQIMFLPIKSHKTSKKSNKKISAKICATPTA
jgi:hypothetical protein